MKTLLTILMILVAQCVFAAEKSESVTPAATVIKGVVIETKDVENYTYLHLKTKDGDIWAAVSTAAVKKGAEVTIENVMVMNNFESKSLNRNFPTIIFGTLGGASGSVSNADTSLNKAHSGLNKTAIIGDTHVAKATGTNARTVSEIMEKGPELKDKPVLVRGKVVKYNPDIMGKNWIHLRDGSGSEVNGTNDILVTSTNPAKIGDVVTVKGIIHTDKDFGAGYSYKVLIEEATLQP